MSDIATSAVASSQNLGLELGVAMLKKGQEVMEAQAQSLLQLVESVPSVSPDPGSSLGQNVDTYA